MRMSPKPMPQMSRLTTPETANTSAPPSSERDILPCWYESVRWAALISGSSSVLLFVWLSERQPESVRMLNLLVMAFMDLKSSDAVPFCSRQYLPSRPIFGQESLAPFLPSSSVEGSRDFMAVPALVFHFVLAEMAALHCSTRLGTSPLPTGLPSVLTPRPSPSMLLTKPQPLRTYVVLRYLP